MDPILSLSLLSLAVTLGFCAYMLRELKRHKTTGQSLKETQEHYRGLIESAFDGVVIYRNGRILFTNKAYCQMFGYGEKELVGMAALDLVHPDHREEVAQKFAQQAAGVHEIMCVKKDGSKLPVEYSAQDCSFEGEPARMAAVRDLSGRKNAEETIRHQAYHDTLTGLPNRMLFHDHLMLELGLASRHNHTLAVLFLDLDRLKTINDILGHGVGDQLIKGVSVRLRSCLAEGDTIARLGGDEFTIILPMLASPDEAAKTSRRILEALAPAFQINGHEVHSTVSIGVSLYPRDGTDVDSLLKNADAALYRAKENGRNNFQIYQPAMNAKATEKLGLENGLRHALARDEFILHYQPQVDIITGKFSGVEALIRWKHPELGLIYPDRFIALSEETGLIVPIGEWVFRQACRQTLLWQKAGLNPPVMAVNLSARQFQRRDLAASLAQVLKDEGVDPSMMELEITESVAMQDADFTSRVLRVLKKLGLRVAMDDFGTGHSSLSYLKKFPLDTLKIDRSFVRELQTSHYDKAIVKAVIGVASQIGLRVVAEGVETDEQLAYLRDEGCHSIQGYLFSRPVEPDEISRLLGEKDPFAR